MFVSVGCMMAFCRPNQTIFSTLQTRTFAVVVVFFFVYVDFVGKILFARTSATVRTNCKLQFRDKQTECVASLYSQYVLSLLLNVVTYTHAHGRYSPLFAMIINSIFGFLSLPHCSLWIKWPNFDGEIKATAKLQMKNERMVNEKRAHTVQILCAHKKRSWPNCNVNNQKTFNQCLL